MIKRLAQFKPLSLTIMVFMSVACFSSNLHASENTLKTDPFFTDPSLIEPSLKEELANAIADADSFDDEFSAQVWLVDMSARLERYVKDPKERLTLLRMVHQEATRAEVSPELVLSIIHIESLFNPYAVSYVGAQGLMQVMPFWKKEIGRVDDNLINSATNLRYGCTILKHYLKREKGNWVKALARYNGSVGRMKYPNKVLGVWQRYWFVDHL
mgnify:FL=1